MLDPSFGNDGLVTLPSEAQGYTAFGAATRNGDVIGGGGPDLQLLASSGGPAEIFGGQGALTPPPAPGGEFSLDAFTLDAKGRLLVIGTSRFPEAEAEAPGSAALFPASHSEVRILRLLPDGTLDPSFGEGGVVETGFGLPPPRDEEGRPLQQTSAQATGVAVDPQGRIVVTGGAVIAVSRPCARDVTSPLVISAAFIARLSESGAPETSFGRDGVFGGRTLGENPLRAELVGDPVVGPSGAITYRSTRTGLCRPYLGHSGIGQLTSGGRTRKTLGTNGRIGGEFTALAGEPDGSVVALTGVTRSAEKEPLEAGLIRIGPGGEVERSFGHHGQTAIRIGSAGGSEANSLLVDAKSRILVGGTLVTRKAARAPDGRLVKRPRSALLVVRLSIDGRQEMDFGPNGRVATSAPALGPYGPNDSAMFLDSEGRLVTVHRYDRTGATGLTLARYLLRD